MYWAFLLIAVFFNANLILAQQSGDFTYTSDGSAITITNYTGSGGEAAIPPSIIGLPVRMIASHAFSGKSAMTSVVIPSSVTSIGEHAFAHCADLATVTIPSSVTVIGSGAFSVCSNLTLISVDAANPSFSSFGGVLFNKAHTTLIQYPGGKSGGYAIPSGVINIGRNAFSKCTGLTSVELPSSVTSIGSEAFLNCAGLTSISLPSGVTSIGSEAFSRCKALTSVTIPSSVTSMGVQAFADCDGLTSLVISPGVTSIGSGAFTGCTGLTVVTIPSSVTNIGWYAFSYCYGLTNVTIPSSVTSMGDLAFRYCTAMTSATFLGNAPASFGTGVFWSTAPGFTVCYYEGATGFTPGTWQGYKSIMLGAPGSGFPSWPVLASLPPNRRGPNDRNGPLDLPNLICYAAGIHPLAAVPGDLPALVTVPSVGRAAFRYRRAKNTPGVTLTPQTSTGLASWNAATILASEVIHNSADWETIEVEVPAPANVPLFFRLEAKQP